MKKALSIILIAAAAFGFYGGAIDITDVLDCKDYWEEQGRITDENLTKLEDGIAQLEENSEKYFDGKQQYEDGKKQLADAKEAYAAAPAQLADAEEQLADAETQLSDAKTQLEDGEAQYAAGAQKIKDNEDTIAAAKKMLTAIGQYNTAYEAWVNDFNTLSAIKDDAAAELKKIDTNGALVTIVGFIKPDQKDYLVSNLKLIKDNCGSVEGMYQIVEVNDGLHVLMESLAQLSMLPEYGYIQKAQQIIDQRGFVAKYEALAAKNNTVYPIAEGIIAGAKSVEAIKTGLAQGYTAQAYPILYANIGAELSAQYLPTDVFDYAKDETWQKAGMPIDIFYAETTGLQGIFDALKGTMEPLIAEFDSGKAQLTAARKQLDDGYVQYNAGLKKYNAGLKQYQEGLASYKSAPGLIADGEAKLADAESQLGEYEDGEQTLKDALHTLITTEAQGGLKSIEARIGEGEDFLDLNGHIDFEMAKVGAKAGRDYSSDSGDAITPELTNRAIAAAVGLGAAALALIGALIGLGKKKKLAGAFGILGAIAAVVAIAMTKAAGDVWVGLAGSTVGTMPIIAFGVVAGVALIFGIAQFAAKKA